MTFIEDRLLHIFYVFKFKQRNQHQLHRVLELNKQEDTITVLIATSVTCDTFLVINPTQYFNKHLA